MRRNNKIYRLLVIVLILCLSIGYAVLNSTLKINGTSNIQKNTWDVHFESIYVVVGSVDAVVEPTISEDVNINFEVTLDKPGDYFEFYVDVVNRGTIDAIISSFQKTPDLSDSQKKYLNYIIEYQNGEQITTKQLVKANSFSKIKVRVEYKKDLIASDLPTADESLNLGFIVNYVQADESGSLVTNNGFSNELITIKSGNGRQIGDEVCIKDECFNVISSDEDTITLFAKYNLMVGNLYDEDGLSEIENPSGIQDPLAQGLAYNEDGEELFPRYGTLEFSDSYYWLNDEDVFKPKYSSDFSLNELYSIYVYDENSSLYEPIENYKTYIESLGVRVNEARLINARELYGISYGWEESSLGYLPDWARNTSFWTGFTISFSTESAFAFWVVYAGGNSDFVSNDLNYQLGIRPVIMIPISELHLVSNNN